MSVRDIYDRSIRPLSPGDRLRLAAMILNDIAKPPRVYASDEWTEEDLSEFSAATWSQIEQELGESANG